MKKILLSLFALLAVTFSANAETKEVVFDFTANPWNLPLGEGTTSPSKDAGDISAPIVQDGVTISFTNSTDEKATPSRMWSVKGKGQLRIYAGNSITITAPEGMKVGVVEITKGSKYTVFTPSEGEFSTLGTTWTGFTQAVTYTATAQVQINKLVVTLTDKALDAPDEPQATGDGTLANPYNAIAALEIASNLKSGAMTEKDVYVKGIISTLDAKNVYGTQFGNATFYISEDGTAKNEFYVFRALYLGNEKYDDESKTNIKLGDEVIICGKLMNYNGTAETAAGKAYLYSLNGITTSINNITVAPTAKQTIYSIDGRKLNKLVKGINIVNGKKVIK